MSSSKAPILRYVIRPGLCRAFHQSKEDPMRITWFITYPVAALLAAVSLAQHEFPSASQPGTGWKVTAPAQGSSTRFRIYKNPANPNLLYQTDEDGSLQISEDGGARWEQTAPPLEGKVVINLLFDRRDASVLYAQGAHGRVARSSDGGNSWEPLVEGLDLGEPFSLRAPLEQSAVDHTLWTAGERVYRFDAGSQRWIGAGQLLKETGRTETATAIGLSPSDPSLVLAVSNSGRVYRNEHALEALPDSQWNHVPVRGGIASRVVFSDSDPAQVYLALRSAERQPGEVSLYKSLDGGHSWIPASGSGAASLPSGAVLNVAVDPGDANRVYAASHSGLFLSLDGGLSWQRERIDAEAVDDIHLSQQGSETVLAVTTPTQGLIESAAASGSSQQACWPTFSPASGYIHPHSRADTPLNLRVTFRNLPVGQRSQCSWQLKILDSFRWYEFVDGAPSWRVLRGRGDTTARIVVHGVPRNNTNPRNATIDVQVTRNGAAVTGLGDYHFSQKVK
jgi:photosystem II stability/assembly factor-like uncharacterized protein